MANKNKFGEAIKALRKNNDITQAKLSEIIVKSPGVIGQYERGEIKPTYETLSKLIYHFDVDANLFFERKNEIHSIENILLLNLLNKFQQNDIKIIKEFINSLLQILP